MRGQRFVPISHVTLLTDFFLHCSDDFLPIPGTKRVKYLEENAKAIDVKLTPEEEQAFRKAVESVGGSKGARYPPAMMAKCFGDSPAPRK